MNRFKTTALLISLALGAVSAGALASGSESFSNAPNNDTRLYNMGKGVFANKFACSSCPLAGKSLDAAVAREVLGGQPRVSLSTDEARALSTYLKRRFSI